MDEFESSDTWHESQQFIDLVLTIAAIMDRVDEEIEFIRLNDLDESVVERMIRDVKAAGFNQVDVVISSFI